MAEFRKIPNNDKLLFGILIAIVIFNSMIPRVVEGITSSEKYFFNTSTPLITTERKGTAPTVDENVISISGVFRTSATVPAGNSIIFKFPPKYFAQIPGTELTNVRLTIQKGGADVFSSSTAVTATSSASDLAGTSSADSTIKFPLPTGVNISPNAASDRDYTFKLYSTSTTPNTAIFKFGSSPIGMTANGFKVGSEGFTEATATMPVLYKEATAQSGTGSGSSNTMLARQSAFVDNVTNLQTVEKELFDKLATDTNLSPSDRSEIVKQINQLAKARGDLYNNMNDFSSQIETVAGERRNALVQNSVAVNVIQDQIQNSQKTLDGLQQEKSNKMRLVEINNYYGKKYEFQTDIMKLIILTCVPLLVISVLLKKGLIPNLVATGLIIIIISVGLIAVAHKVIDLNKRNKFNFDQYDHDFNPNAVQVSKTESTNLSDINKAAMASSCFGASCCTEDTTVWDSATSKCVPKPAQAGGSAASGAASVPGSASANAAAAVTRWASIWNEI